MFQTAILPITYFGPLQFYSKYFLYEKCMIESCEHFVKQTFRNRCEIYGANGKHALSIPVIKPNGNKTIIKDVQIDYATKWQHNHQRAIESAYRSSPFFEYYIDEFVFVFVDKPKFLMDLNTQIQQVVFDILEIEQNIELSASYTENLNAQDYRTIISPKTELSSDVKYKNHIYPQVFEDKHGFLSNLSILDLIFNEGPSSRVVLQNCIKI